MRGLAYLKKKKYAQAIANCSEALQRDTKMAPACRDRGYA
jgi:hypothetical protein